MRHHRLSRRLLILLSVVSLLSGSLFVASTALAVNATGAFEVADGNALTEAAVAGNDDADRVCYQDAINEGLTAAAAQTRCTINSGTSAGNTAASWVDASEEATIFTGGGSKDPQNPGTDWLWKAKDTVPDKDTIEHAFAARYSLTPSATTCPVPTGATKCEVIYFGVDRFDNSGDAQLGFWFFKNPIALTSISSQGGFKFSGDHAPGDLLLISQFSGGGTTSTIEAHFWDPTCKKAAQNVVAGACSGANLRLQQRSTQANCASSAPTAPFCGIVNGATIPAQWDFTDKTTGDAPKQYLIGEYYEAGVNLSQLGIGDACFPSFVAESRSSTSTTATLKDFVLGNFQNCSALAVTTPSSSDAEGNPGSVSPGTPVTDHFQVSGGGTATPPYPTSSTTAPGRGNKVIFRICGPIPSPEMCDGSTGHVGTQVGAAKDLTPVAAVQGRSEATSDAVNTALNPLAPGRYCFSGSWAGDDNYTSGASDSSLRECFTVTDTTSMTSAQNWLPNDSATVSATGGTALSGTLTATLYLSGDCTGSVAKFADNTDVTYSKTLTSASTAADRTLTTSNSTFKVSATATVSWKVSFTSSDTNVGNSEHCESTALTITN